MNETLKKELQSTFNGVEIVDIHETRTAIIVPSVSVPVVLRKLKESGLNRLSLLSCVDWIGDGKFEIVYILTSYMQNDDEYTPNDEWHVFLKTKIPRDHASLKSAIDIFENAEPYEREIHELFGVHFDGHPRLTPLFLTQKYEVPPFRKDFDTRQYVKDTYDAIPMVED